MDTIRVRLLTHASGPDFSLSPGTEADLDRAQAEAMIAGGYAELVSEPEPEPETAQAIYTMTDPAKPAAVESAPPVETATAAPQRSQEADELVAAERDGRAAAEAGEPRKVPNGIDGRSAQGRAWLRGYDLYHRPERK